MVSLKIIYEDNHLLVIEKPVNIPVQADSSHDDDLLSMIKTLLKKKYDKPGNVFVGLVHRLDRPVGGVMVFAKTSKAAQRLSEQIRLQAMEKTYQCITDGIAKQGLYVDYLLKNTSTNTVTIHSKGKKAELEVLAVTVKNNYSHCILSLKTGRSHQIRVQMASRNTPIWGDARYNKTSKPGQQIALWATSLQFAHPISKELLTFYSDPPQQFPWNQF